jgi:ATP-binding cassette subfamily B protein
MKLPIPFFESRSVGDILQRIQDHRRLEQFLSEQSLMMLFSVFNLLVFGIVLLLYDFWIFFLYLAGTVLYIIWVLIFMKKREKIDYMRFDQMSNSQSSSVQIIQGMPEIKLNNSEKRRRWEWEETQVRFFKVEMKNLSLLHVQRTGGTFISELKNILLTYVAAKGVIDGEISLGTMISIQYIIGQLNNPIRSFIDFIMAYQNARISLDRISDIHTHSEEDNSSGMYYHEPPGFGDIVISDLLFKYQNPSAPYIFSGLDLVIPQGKVTAIVGVSGSGKTTLMKLLLKVYELKGGSIKIGDFNLSDIDTRAWRQKCGVVMQDGYIFADTILRNITESDSEVPVDRKRLSEAIRIANLEELISSLPNGFNTMLSTQGGNLSGGQRQRLLIARAVYKNPEYLFFDEATSALDANNERAIMENLESFYTNKTVIIIAHRLSTVRNADQIIVLDEGRVLEKGHHDDLVKLKGKYFALVKNQLELGS